MVVCLGGVERILVAIFVFFDKSAFSKTPDVTLISHHSQSFFHETTELWCVSNDSSAISWTYTSTLDDDKDREFFPKIHETFSCTFENGQTCTNYWLKNPWKITNNTLVDYFGPILDRRWESFPVHVTEDRDAKNQTFRFLKSGTFSRDFKVAFSVKIKFQAQIFFCNGFPRKSKCYWFLIGGWDGKTSGLRKCDIGQVPLYTRVYPEDPCAMFKKSVNHTAEEPLPLKEDEWRNFVVSKKGGMISLREAGTTVSFLNYRDDDPIESDTFEMYVLSRSVRGYWKIHTSDFLYTTEASTRELGPRLEPIELTKNGQRNYHLCLKMFVVICDGCFLTVRLKNGRNHYEKTFKSKTKNNWQEIRYVEENLTYDYYTMYIITHGKSTGFWAIDDVRQCSSEEVRVATTKVYDDAKISCQILGYPLKLLREDDSVGAATKGNLCPFGTFGQYCTPCDLVFGENSKYCQNKKLCTLDDNLEVKCHCPHGYTGKNCDEECPDGTYGFACSQKCGKCSRSYCDKMTGICPNGCDGNFLDNLCKISPLTLVHPPKILRVGNDFCEVQLTSVEISGNFSKPHYYHYQISSQNSQKWLYTNEPYLITDVSPKTIKKLNISTIYHVRAVLVSKDNHRYESEQIPYETFKTSCTAIKNTDLDVSVKNTSAVITLKPFHQMCPIGEYQIFLKDKEQWFVRNQVIVDNLLPYTNHTVKFYRKHKHELDVNFMTLDGVPSVVNGVQTTNKGPNFISLKWNPPLIPNGKIRHYTITFWNAGRIPCGETSKGSLQNFPRVLKRTNTRATLENLEAYTRYFVEIYANTALKGNPLVISEETSSSDVIDPSEIPTTINVEPGDTFALIKPNGIPCQNQKGPIFVDITAQCSNEWCKTTKYFKGMLLDNHPLKIDNLEPYSDYSIKILFRRPSGVTKNGMFPILRSFRTVPGVPPPVRNLSVYAQTKNEVFLSWLPPYPPGGVLEAYQIVYVADGYSIAYRRTVIVPPKPCKIWRKKHCGLIGELDEHRSYHFQVFAKNYNNDNYNNGYQAQTPFATKSEMVKGSSKPTLLSYQWKNDNQLVLVWFHPDFTSGLIKHFQITLKSGTFEKYENYTIVNYNLYNTTYEYQIRTIFKKSTKYTVSVCAVTYINSGFKSVLMVSTPPEKPRLRAPPQIVDTMNKAIKLVIPAYDSSKSSTNDESYLFITITESSLKCPHRKGDLEMELIEHTNSSGTPCIILSVPLNETAKTKGGLTVIIGHNQGVVPESSKSPYSGVVDILEKPLSEDATYNLSVLLLNEFEGVRRYNLYRLDLVRLGQIDENATMMDGSSNLALLSLLLFVLVPPIIWVVKKHVSFGNLLRRNPSGNLSGDKMEPDLIPLSVKPPQLVHPPSADTQKVWSKPIQIGDLEEYVKKSVISGDLEKQHQELPRGATKGCEYGSAKPNKLKNRYNNLIAYDHTRVRLQKLPDEEFSDYINANYIDGYKRRNAYIATQGPKMSTLGDFWRMIWQEKVKYVVMLANLCESGKSKCEKYWPDLNESVQHGDVTIRYVSSDIFADYQYRVFDVVCGNEKRCLEQLHFTSWPDHGVPLYPQTLVPFLKKISKIEYDFPIVVHCSAGVGRTGTIILCDVCLRMANTEGSVDFFGTLHNMREQRVNMVDNPDQYKLAHLVLLECLLSPCSTIPCNSTMKTTIKRILTDGTIEEQMEYLQNIRWQNEILQNDETPQMSLDTSHKNRFQEITPDTNGRVFLQPYPTSDESSTYINAVLVDGYRSPQKYIATQQPLPNTLGDFWRLVAEREISVIVSLNPTKKGDQTSCTFWPGGQQQELKPLQYITLKYKNTTDAVVYQITTLAMQVHGKHQNVSVIAMKDWDQNSMLPTVPEKLLLLCEEVTRLSRSDGHVLVTCYDGATACGVFLSLIFVIEKIKLEQECDVCLAVRTVRRYRKQFVTNREQFKFLYEAALKYMEEFETYSNFGGMQEF